MYASVLGRSKSLRETIQALASEPRDQAARVLAFVNDLDGALESAAASVRSNGYLLWTLGNRRVGNREVPLHRILKDAFARISLRLRHHHRPSHSVQANGVEKFRRRDDQARACIDPAQEGRSVRVMKAPVNIDANVIRQLGDELVTDAEQALLELIKNSYDADADWVRLFIDSEAADNGTPPGTIRVEDNGSGMHEDQLKNGWLRIVCP
jgi:C4-dicarboxylate-specific signal transduction histidine kinase